MGGGGGGGGDTSHDINHPKKATRIPNIFNTKVHERPRGEHLLFGFGRGAGTRPLAEMTGGFGGAGEGTGNCGKRSPK